MQAFFHSLSEAMRGQLFAGGIALMFVGAITALCRRVPEDLWQWLKRQCTVTLDVMNSDPAFDWITDWLNESAYAKRARKISLSTARGDSSDDEQIRLTPAPGNHFFLHRFSDGRRRFVWLHRQRDEGGAGAGEQLAALLKRETYNIRVFGRTQARTRELVEEARKVSRSLARSKARLFVSTYGYWCEVGALPVRPLESVILPAGVAESIVSDVREFIASKELYRQRGIPYRRGYLLEGVPGAGKSSIIGALAHGENLNLYVLGVGSPGMSDEALAFLMATVRDNSIILFEDIDACLRGRELSADAGANQPAAMQKGITFSGLLNALDGVAAREDCMIFMTTNHVEKLDPALIRPGRVDVRVHFDSATRDQFARLFSRFYPGHEPGLSAAFAYALEGKGRSMAEAQQLLLTCKTDPALAVERARELTGAA